MKWRLAITLTLAVVLTVTAISVGRWRVAVRDRQLATLNRKFADADDAGRVTFGQQLLQIDSTREEVRLLLAAALIRTGRYLSARNVLAPFRDRYGDRFTQAQHLRAESYLAEAKVFAAKVNSAVDVGDRVSAWLESALAVISDLASRGGNEALVPILKAQVFDVKLLLLRQQLRQNRSTLGHVWTGGTGELLDENPDQQTHLHDQIAQTRQALQQVCDAALQIEPDNTVVRAIVFHTSLEAGDFAAARRVAQQLAELAALDGETAGEVAETLLNLESLYAQTPRRSDLDLAVRLIRHPNLSHHDDVAWRVANLALLMRQGQAEPAMQNAREVLQFHPGHPRTICLLAEAEIQLGRAEAVRERLERFRNRVDSWRVAQTLGLAMLACGQTQVGHDTLKHAIEMNPSNLRARLVLAESMAAEGHVVEAEPEIIACWQLNRSHPRVLKLQARLLVETLRRQPLIDMITGAGTAGSSSSVRTGDRSQQQRRVAEIDEERVQAPPQVTALAVSHDEVLLASAMALDNRAMVASYRADHLGGESAGALAFVADAWLATKEPLNRVAVAAVVVHVLAEHIAPDPLQHVALLGEEDSVGVPSHRPGVGGAESLDGALPHRQLLAEAPFYRWLHQEALDLVELALDRWPQSQALREQGQRLSLWLNWSHQMPAAPAWRPPEHTPTQRLIDLLVAHEAFTTQQASGEVVDRVLATLLEHHPWSIHAVLMLVADALEQRQDARLPQILAVVEKHNHRLRQWIDAHLELALGRPLVALVKMDSLLQGEPGRSTLRGLSADMRARANLVAGRYLPAAGVFETLAVSRPDRSDAARIAAVDVMIDAGKSDDAVALLRRLMMDPSLTDFWFAAVLVRAEHVMGADQLLDMIEAAQRNTPLLLMRFYEGRALIRLGKLVEAEQAVSVLRDRYRDAPRVLMLDAKLALAQGQTERARQIYARLIECGGVMALAAERQLSRLRPSIGHAAELTGGQTADQ